MALSDVCVHVATPLRETEDKGDWVEGEYRTSGKVPGTPFDCCLFLPIGEEESGGGTAVRQGGRQVTRPTLLFLPEDHAGAQVSVNRELELLIVAEELNLARGMAANASERWLVDGDPQPFGKPGDDVIGYQARLSKVDE